MAALGQSNRNNRLHFTCKHYQPYYCPYYYDNDNYITSDSAKRLLGAVKMTNNTFTTASAVITYYWASCWVSALYEKRSRKFSYLQFAELAIWCHLVLTNACCGQGYLGLPKSFYMIMTRFHEFRTSIIVPQTSIIVFTTMLQFMA